MAKLIDKKLLILDIDILIENQIKEIKQTFKDREMKWNKNYLEIDKYHLLEFDDTNHVEVFNFELGKYYGLKEIKELL